MTHTTRCLMPLVLVAGMSPSRVGAADGNEPIPPSADLVVCIELRQLLNSPLGLSSLSHLHVPGQETIHRVGDLLRWLRVEPARDIERVIWSVSSAHPDRGWMVIRGRFGQDPNDSSPSASSRRPPDEIRIHQFGDERILEALGSPPIFFQVLDEQTLVCSSHLEWLREWKSWHPPRRELARLMEQAAQGTCGWIVALSPTLAMVPTADEKQRQCLERIESVVGLLRVHTTIRFDLCFRVPDPPTSTALQQFLRLSLDRAKQWQPLGDRELPELGPILDWLTTFRLAATAEKVVLSSELSDSQVRTIFRPWLKLDK